MKELRALQKEFIKEHSVSHDVPPKLVVENKVRRVFYVPRLKPDGVQTEFRINRNGWLVDGKEWNLKKVGVPHVFVRKSPVQGFDIILADTVWNDDYWTMRGFEVSANPRVEVNSVREIVNQKVFAKNIDEVGCFDVDIFRYRTVYPSLAFFGLINVNEQVEKLRNRIYDCGCSTVVEIYVAFATSLFADSPPHEDFNVNGKKFITRGEFGVVTYHELCMFGIKGEKKEDVAEERDGFKWVRGEMGNVCRVISAPAGYKGIIGKVFDGGILSAIVDSAKGA